MLERLRETAMRMHVRRTLQEQHPDEPWLWREDWAQRAIRDNSGFAYIGCTWAFGLVWTLFSLPIALIFLATSARLDPTLLFALVFPIIGLTILGFALYLTLRQRKFGTSLCRIDRVPIALGSRLRGEIETRVMQVPESGFRVRLISVRRHTRYSGSKRRTSETTLYSDEQTVGRGAVVSTPNGVRIPFAFNVPRHADPTNESDRDDLVLWRLHASGDVPGIDYAALFELPVFGTAETPFVHTSALTAPDSGVAVEHGPEGEEIVVEGQRRWAEVFGWFAFAVFWFGIIGYMWRMGMPRWFGSIFLAVGVLFTIFTFDLILGRTRLRATRRELTIRRSWLGLGRTRTLDATLIEAVESRLGTSSGGRTYYDVVARMRGGRVKKIAKHITHKSNAEAVAARVRRAIGR